ncbi:MAG: HTTM domain-containing protein [Acidimicrobiales bacterium]
MRSVARRLQPAQWPRRLDDWLQEPAPPERLATLRLAIGGYALVNLFVSFGEFDRLARRPADEFEPVGLASLLSGPVAPEWLWTLFALSALSGAGFVAGVWYRVSGPVFALGTLAWATYHASWGQMLHFEHLVTLHLLVLGWSPAADALSLRSGRRASVEGRTAHHGWPVRLMAIITVITYALAGIAKLRNGGLAWADGTTLANHIAYSATRLDLLGEPRPPLATFVIGRAQLLGPMALAGLAVELLAPLALFGGRFRRIWVPSIVAFHLGTLLTMFVFFSYNGLGFALLPLYRVERVAAFLDRSARRIAGR